MSHIKRGEYFPFNPVNLGNGDPRRMNLQKEKELLIKETQALREQIAELEHTIEGLRYYEEKHSKWLEAYDNAARKFIEKVDTGRASSTETYRELRSCLRRGAGPNARWE